MDERQNVRSLFIIIILFLLFFPVRAFSGNIIKLGGFEYPPFYSMENGEMQGIAVELFTELFRRMDLDISLRMYPLKRALHYMEEGSLDGVMFLIKTPEREKYLFYSDPIMTILGLIWSAADRKGGAVEFERLEDLKPYRIGVTIGYSYGKEFDEILKTMNVDKASRDYNNYQKLLNHRIEIFAGNEIVAKGLFKKHPEFQGKFVHSKKAFMEWGFHMGISQKSRLVPLIPEINRILADFRREGLIDRTVRQYTE